VGELILDVNYFTIYVNKNQPLTEFLFYDKVGQYLIDQLFFLSIRHNECFFAF